MTPRASPTRAGTAPPSGGGGDRIDSECARDRRLRRREPAGPVAGEQLDGVAAVHAAAFHRPRFSSGLEHGGDPALEPLWAQLADGGVDIVLNGHEHDYERFAPRRRRPGRQRPGGVRRGHRRSQPGAFSRVERGSEVPLGRFGRRAGDDPAARRLRLALRRPGRHPAGRQRYGDLPGTVGGRGWLNGLSRSGAGSPLDEGTRGHIERNPRARRHSPRHTSKRRSPAAVAITSPPAAPRPAVPSTSRSARLAIPSTPASRRSSTPAVALRASRRATASAPRRKGK